MVLPMNWAKEFADFDCSAKEMADRLTMTGSKVECYENAADAVENVVIGRIESIVPHPDSDHMVICQVEVGQDAPLQIVTGAANLKVGDLVPVALDGSKLPGGVEIKTGVLRGVESCGMLCSLGELGLTTHDFPYAIENGILVLDERDYPDGMPAPGTPAVEALGMDDVVFEFEITPNRPDCLAVRELGRECAATFGVPFKDHTPTVKPGHGNVNDLLKVDIENSELCMRYCGAVVENVRVAPSPKWMRDRLRACGVRPINNLVDITNYVMLEYGQPMHCFDHKYVNGQHIHVRNAKPGEHIVTLDGVDRALSEEMLVIADDAGPIGVAGVMGGEYSGTYEHTTTVVFESAMFYGPSIRTTAKKLGLQTEASAKYSKGLDPKMSFKIMEKVRKGKVKKGGFDEGWEEAMMEHDVPDWYIESLAKIGYLFPKAHAVAYVMMAFRIAWFKVHEPLAFYATFFSVRAKAFDAEYCCAGMDAVKRKIKEIENNKDATAVEQNLLTTLEVCYEFYLRGFHFDTINIYKSDATKFVVTEKGLLPPFVTVHGLGEAAALDTVEKRKGKEFISIEEFAMCCNKLSKTHIEQLKALGAFAGMADTSQITLF